MDDLLGNSDDAEDEASVRSTARKTAKFAQKPLSGVAPKRVYNKAKHLECPHCKLSLKPHEYKAHVKQDHAKPCRFCSLRFTYDHGLEDHVAREHEAEQAVSNSEALRCGLCALSFTRLKALENHRLKAHSGAGKQRSAKLKLRNQTMREQHGTRQHKVKRDSKPSIVRRHPAPVMVKTENSNAMIQDSPRKSKFVIPKKKGTDSKEYKPSVVSNKKPNPKKSKQEQKENRASTEAVEDSLDDLLNGDLQEPSALPEDDTVCEQCGARFPDFEEFAAHIELRHDYACSALDCEKSFIHEFYLQVMSYWPLCFLNFSFFIV